MNQEKAREFFSAYYEGTLDGGLRQTFEQRLKADPDLQREYRSFEETMSQLDTLKFEEIEVPSFLADRIATRLESVQERKQAKTPTWAVWLRGLSFSAVAAVAVFGAIYNLTRPAAGTGMSGVAPAAHVQPTFDVSGSDLVLQYKPGASQTVIVSSQGRELTRIDLKKDQALRSPLRNTQKDAVVFDVKVQGTSDEYHVAVPGTSALTTKSGQGSISEFAAALAGHFRTPVEVNVADANKPMTWAFDGTDAYDSADANMKALGAYSVLRLESGVIQIVDR